MTETKRHIEELKKAIPSLKERVVAVALLLALSLVMIASVSYAWVTMSVSPELGGVNTTVAANGALEIALSDFDGAEPNTSAVGDSFAAENQTFHNANVSWGNLVNLSTGYGIESLVLRPAALDLLSEVPLYGVQYSEDGRVEGSLSDFGYTTWYRENEDADWAFIVPQADSNNVYPAQFPDGKYYGVRAISSVAYKSDASAEMKRLLRLVDMQRESRDNYITMTEDTDNIQVITNLVQEYLDQNIDAAVDAVLGGTYNEPNFEMNGSTYVPALTNMLNYFYSNVILEAGEAMVYAANLQRTSGDEYTLDDLLAADRATLLENGVKLAALGYNEKTGTYSNPQYFKQLHDDVKTDLTTLQSSLFWDANGKAKNTIMWFDLKPVVNHLIHIDSLTVEGKTINQIAGLRTGALSFVNGLPEHAEVVLYQGYLYDFEDLMGGKFMLMVIPIKAQKMGVLNYNGYGDIHTDVSRTKDSMFATDLNTVQKQLNAVDNRKMTAQDTYGMVLDLWIRTNGENSMLMLNGTPEIETYQQQLQMIPSGESEKRNVWVYEAYTGDVVELTEGYSQFETQEILVYKKDESKDSEGNYNTDGDYYNCTSNLLVCKIELQENNDGTYTAVQTDTPITSTDVDPKQETLERVVGYHSANRIWKDDDTENNPPVLEPMMGEISTTQGSGSCYIFHADTPEASARALELLSNLRLVFLNDQGKELAQASLDVKHVYAENGKYTVPIAVNRSSYVVTDEDNNSTYAICPLFKNEPVRISVLVYLDGSQLTNEMVMSKDDIVGSLNLQFDSSADLRSLGDSALSLDVLSISADVSTDYFTYAGDPVSTKLTATVSGITAAKVEAYFQRQINATQGSRQETIALSDEDKDGTWEANATFTTPGVYVMSSLLVDGIEYDLPESISVTVDGFGVSSVSFDESAALSTGRSISRDVSVTINSTIQPSSVEARFMTSDGHSVSASLRASSASASGVTWVGSATFTNSGTYILQYLVMDGQYYELSDGSPDPNGLPTSRLQRVFTAYLGLTAEVTLERYNWVNGEIEKDSYGNNVILPLSYDFTQVENIYAFVQIFDDAGNLMTSLGNMDLYYYSEGSSLPENGFICPDMTWNGTYYVGTFKADKPGIFHFGRIDVGSQVISSAASAPTMQLRSLEPPAFVSHVTDSQILVADGEVFYQVEIDEARTAQRWVVFENLDSNQSFEVPLLPSGIEDVYQAAFPDLVPNADVFSSNGSWKVSKLLFTNVYVNGEFYNDSNNKFVMDNFLPAEFTVVNYLTMDVEPIVLGATVAKDGTVTKTGAFMQSYPLNGDTPLQLVVSAPGVGADVLQKLITEMKIVINYTVNTSLEYGGYSYDEANLLAPLTIKEFNLISSEGNILIFNVAADAVLHRAGHYTFDGQITLNENTTFSNEKDGFSGTAAEVYSITPSVYISAVTPAPGTSYSVDDAVVTEIEVDSSKAGYFKVTYTTNSAHTAGKYSVISNDGESATVFYKCLHRDDQTYTKTASSLWEVANLLPDYHNYIQPTVTITIADMGNANRAELPFVDSNNQTAKMYATEGGTSGNSNPEGYIWNYGDNVNCTRYIGNYRSQKFLLRNDSKEVAGTVTSSNLILYYDYNNDGTDEEYLVHIVITINNPN